MHAFWLVLTYDLLEDKRIDDVIIKNFFFPYILILYCYLDGKIEQRSWWEHGNVKNKGRN